MVARFETSDKRFEVIDLRMGDLMKSTDHRFNALIKTMDDGFAGVKENIGVVKWFVVSSFVVIGTAMSLLAFLQ